MNKTPAPYRPPMSWEERARRAEALAAQMAEMLDWTLSALLPRVPASYADRDALGAALARWAAHRADLDTLDQTNA